jgi:hypothetical protein
VLYFQALQNFQDHLTDMARLLGWQPVLLWPTITGDGPPVDGVGQPT